MAEGKLFQARCKKCGDKVTSEWRDYNTYPGVLNESGNVIHGFEDESVYTGDSDKNDTGLWCNGCEAYVDESDVVAGEEYIPSLSKMESVVAAIKLLQDMNDVSFIKPNFGNLIDEVVFNLQLEHGLLDPAKEAVPGQVIDDPLLIDDLEE